MSPQSSLASLWDMDRHKRHPHGLHHAVLSCLAMAVSQVIPENNPPQREKKAGRAGLRANENSVYSTRKRRQASTHFLHRFDFDLANSLGGDTKL